ncbi:MAG: metallophosphoesterase [Bacteroidales bacterium]|nr:metallophosphoesterase [Bacteroidales bacterium]MCM1146281.1 metallophosphoesterase [Bacteroidales bacterium]MCM1205281.1 metallophosphoesterase [Bacillota bacterium]MCM1509632.1 metallophosphoesterase [Clostridium sp.]
MTALLFLLLLIPDIYIWYMFLRHVHWAWQGAFFVPVIAAILCMVLVQTPVYQAWMFRMGMTLLLIFTAPKLFFMLFSLTGLAVRPVLPAAWRVMNGAGTAAAMALLGIVFYGTLIGWKRLAVNEVELSFRNLPDGFDGYRIALLSDMHIETYGSAPECVEKIVSEVNRQKPDMVCFTGDLVNSSPKELDGFMDILPEIKAKDGVFSIMGNHDYCTYARYNSRRDHLKAVSELQERERGFGWQLLNNENRTIHHNGDSILLAGVENSSRPPFPDYGDLPKALATEGNESFFTILLSHDPTHWRRSVLQETDVQLQLSGHTHSTQFRIFGWTPASLIYKEYAGLYEEGDRKLFVCTGTGGNLPFRFGVWPEIVIITLRKG